MLRASLRATGGPGTTAAAFGSHFRPGAQRAASVRVFADERSFTLELSPGEVMLRSLGPLSLANGAGAVTD
jgi:hypothetical protein